MQVEMYRGPRTPIVIAAAVLAIATTLAILIAAGPTADGADKANAPYSQSTENVQPSVASETDQDAPLSTDEIRFQEMNVLPDASEEDERLSIEEIRLLEMNQLPELRAEFAGISAVEMSFLEVNTQLPGAIEPAILSTDRVLFLEQNTVLPEYQEPMSIEEIRFLEENTWGE